MVLGLAQAYRRLHIKRQKNRFIGKIFIDNCYIYVINNTAFASDVIRPDEYYFVFNGQRRRPVPIRNEERSVVNLTAGT